MIPAKRKAIGGYGLLSITVALVFAFALILLSPEFTGLFTSESASVIEKTFPLNSNFTESGSPHVIAIPQGETMKSLKVTGIIYGKGKVKILLVSGGKQWIVMEKDTEGTAKPSAPFTGMATGLENASSQTYNPAGSGASNMSVPETEANVTLLQEENASLPEEKTTESQANKTGSNASLEEESTAIPEDNATHSENVTQPESNETNATLQEANETSSEESTIQSQENATNVTVPEQNAAENAATPEENTTGQTITGNITETNETQNITTPEENITSREENETLPEENITQPQENATEPKENITLPEENATIPVENVTENITQSNVTENITKPEVNVSVNETTETPTAVYKFKDVCLETCILPNIKNAELVAVVEGDAVLYVNGIKYEAAASIKEGEVTGKDKINKALRKIDPAGQSLTSRDISRIRKVYIKSTKGGYEINLEMGNAPYAMTLDDKMLNKLRPGVLTYMSIKPQTRVLVKTKSNAKFLTVDGWENSSLIGRLKPKKISPNQFNTQYNWNVRKYHKKNVFMEVGNGTLIDVEQAADGYVSVTVDTAGLEALLKSGTVQEVLPDRQFLASMFESALITKTDYAYGSGFWGTGKSICVVDSGLNTTALGLTDGSDVFGYNFIGEDGNYTDEYGHGTMVTAPIKYFAPNATIYAAKVMDSNGIAYSSDIVNALDWCGQNGVDVVSISLSEGWYEGYCDFNLVAHKVNELSSGGIVVVAATGNNLKYDAVSNPACASGAIRVAASEKTDRFWMLSNYNNATLLVAPGMDIKTVGNDGSPASVSGTSMSTAMVSAITALLLENTSLTPNETRDLLVHTGDVISYFDNRTNSTKIFSRVNAWNALTGNITNNLTEGPVGNDSYQTWIFQPSSEGTQCTYGTDCSFDEYCVWSGGGSNGVCRGAECDYDSVNMPNSVSGYACVPGTLSNYYATYGTCYDSTPTATGGTSDCDFTSEFSMDCGATCNLGTDVSYYSCSTTSGDACMFNAGGNFAQDGTCASGATYNCDTSSPVAKDGSTYYASCAAGRECDSSVTGGDYSRNGYCASTSCCTADIAADNTIG
ncbi:MAG: hypothetical protein J7K54_04035, partial [Candidatus Aenigmarchaeota archaeon]|nr:hypothetical protein [Candidatus Aenigmarchaeota archaeon]